jgi:hypothetical protein
MKKALSRRIIDTSYRALAERRQFRKGGVKRTFVLTQEPAITLPQAKFLRDLIAQVGSAEERRVQIATLTKAHASRMIGYLVLRKEGPPVPLTPEQVAQRVAAIIPVAPSPAEPSRPTRTRLRPNDIGSASIEALRMDD